MNNIYLTKQDLEKFNPKDINLLAEYFDVHNRNNNDLLWLLAIKIHSDRSQYSQMPIDKEGSSENIPYLEALPVDMLIEVASALDWPSITRVCQTSKTLNERICDNEIFWERSIHHKYPGYEKPKRLPWSMLARELRSIKRMPDKRQLEATIERDQLEIAKILVMYEPENQDIETLFKYKEKPWGLDLLVLHPDSLIHAMLQKDWDLADKLIDLGVGLKINSIPLRLAIRNKKVELAEKLIDAGMNVNEEDHDGTTPLLLATHKDNIKILNKLIKAGADVNKADKDGQTPLFWAARKGHTKISTELIKAGADVNKANKDGQTPLLWAARKGELEILNRLIEAGADVNRFATKAFVSDEVTPLWAAAEKGRSKIVKRLLEAGADRDKSIMEGVTPLWVAISEGHKDVVKILKDAGATILDDGGRY